MFWISIEQIQCFQAVAKHGSFTQASESLNKAKSAIRYSVNNLEEQLGFKVFDRDSYRPKLTPQGESFLTACEQLSNQYQLFQERCSLIAKSVETRIRLSVSGVYPLMNVYPVMESVIERFPGTEFVFEKEILSGEKMLLSEIVDLAIFERLINHEKLESKKLGEVRLLLCVSKDHPFLKLAKKNQIIQGLYKFPQIIQRSTLPEEYAGGVHEQSLQWKVTDIESKKQIIQQGLGWGRLPEHMVSEEIKSGELINLSELNEDINLEVFLARRKSGFFGEVSRFIWEQF